MQGYAIRRFRLLWVLVMHAMLPVWLIFLMSVEGRDDSTAWMMLLVASAAYVAYISIAGSWSWFGIHAQRGMPMVLVVAAFVTRPRFVSVNNSAQAAELRLAIVALAGWFLLWTAWALLGRRAGRESLGLVFPLKSGTFMVAQGGSTRPVNRHAKSQAQRYAVDLVQLGGLGMRADGIYPVALRKYAIFGSEVVSPCDGLVVAAVDDLPDNIPPVRDFHNPEGNHVAIQFEGGTVYLCHLMKGSVTVDVGKRVKTGRVIGRVGSSGESAEPHLHIHAQQGERGIALRFAGRFLVRNDTVEATD